MVKDKTREKIGKTSELGSNPEHQNGDDMALYQKAHFELYGVPFMEEDQIPVPSPLNRVDKPKKRVQKKAPKRDRKKDSMYQSTQNGVPCNPGPTLLRPRMPGSTLRARMPGPTVRTRMSESYERASMPCSTMRVRMPVDAEKVRVTEAHESTTMPESFETAGMHLPVHETSKSQEKASMFQGEAPTTQMEVSMSQRGAPKPEREALTPRKAPTSQMEAPQLQRSIPVLNGHVGMSTRARHPDPSHYRNRKIDPRNSKEFENQKTKLLIDVATFFGKDTVVQKTAASESRSGRKFNSKATQTEDTDKELNNNIAKKESLGRYSITNGVQDEEIVPSLPKQVNGLNFNGLQDVAIVASLAKQVNSLNLNGVQGVKMVTSLKNQVNGLNLNKVQEMVTSDDKALNGEILKSPIAIGSHRFPDNCKSTDLVKYDPNAAKIRNIFDSHCHLDRTFKMLSPDKFKFVQTPKKPLETLKMEHKNLFGPKFEGCITVCCDPRLWNPLDFWHFTNEIGVWLTFGCHPNLAEYFNENSEERLKNILNLGKTVALGEIGLDTFGSVPLDIQEKVFEKQLEIGVQSKKPICLHIRVHPKFVPKAKEIMKKCLPNDWPLHMHCFTDSWQLCQEWMNDYPNMKFGIVPGKYYPEFVENLPLEKLLLESDAPYFVPKELRSKYKVGVPGFLYNVAVEVAEIKKISVDTVLLESRKNVKEIYNI